MFRVANTVARTARVAQAVPRVRTANIAQRFHSAEAAPAKEGGFMANLPRNPNYEGFEGVIRYYLPTNDKFVVFVFSNYAAVIGFFVMRHKAKKAAEAAKAPPPEYPNFSKTIEELNLKL